MALKFKWDLSRDSWIKMIRDYNAPEERLRYEGSDYYGCVYVGNLCIDIVFRCDDPDEWYIDGDIYCLTEDDRRYGYTKTNELPYDYIESCTLAPFNELSFTSFKKDVERKIIDFVETNKGVVPLLAEAYKPLGNWD